jgi:hypothetical protein
MNSTTQKKVLKQNGEGPSDLLSVYSFFMLLFLKATIVLETQRKIKSLRETKKLLFGILKAFRFIKTKGIPPLLFFFSFHV